MLTKPIMKMNFKTVAISLLMSVCLCLSCKKEKEQPQTFDAINRIFRVKATSDGTPYTLTISGTNLNLSANKIEAVRNTGEEFNYGYTPAVGTQIQVTARSTKPISCYVNYKGKYTWQVVLKPNGEGVYLGELTYSVSE